MFIARDCRDDLDALAELVVAGRLTRAIDREYTLSDAREAIRSATSRRVRRAKVLINVDG